MLILREKSNDPHYTNKMSPIALIIVPSRELAVQVFETAEPYGRKVGIDIVCIFGGDGSDNQGQKLIQGCDVLIATPQKLLDFIEGNKVKLHRSIYFVLDEADRMQDMGFVPKIKKIM